MDYFESMTLGTVFNDPTMRWSGRLRSLLHWSLFIAFLNFALFFKASLRAHFIFSTGLLSTIVLIMMLVSPFLVGRYTSLKFGGRLAVLGFAICKYVLIILAYCSFLQGRIKIPTGRLALERLMAFADAQIGEVQEVAHATSEIGQILVAMAGGAITVCIRLGLIFASLIAIPFLLLLVCQALQELIDILTDHILPERLLGTTKK